MVNTGTLGTSLYVNCGGTFFKDLMTGREFHVNGGFNLECDPLTCYIFESI